MSEFRIELRRPVAHQFKVTYHHVDGQHHLHYSTKVYKTKDSAVKAISSIRHNALKMKTRSKGLYKFYGTISARNGLQLLTVGPFSSAIHALGFADYISKAETYSYYGVATPIPEYAPKDRKA